MEIADRVPIIPARCDARWRHGVSRSRFPDHFAITPLLPFPNSVTRDSRRLWRSTTRQPARSRD